MTNKMDIFKDKPGSWGLRGDTYFWDELKNSFKNLDYSKSSIEFSELLEIEFNKIINKGKTTDKDEDTIYFEKYPKGGMSGGYVSKEWWTQTGLPLIKKRYSETHIEINKNKRILLQDILPLDKLGEKGKVILVRHYHENLDEMLQKKLIEEYQSFQRKTYAFKKCEIIVSFLAEPNNQAKLFGVYRNLEIKENENLPKYSKSLEKYCNPQDVNNDLFMVLEKINDFEKFENRIIIDWVVPRGWYNTYGNVKDKEVVKILPYNFVDEFPGLMKIRINAQELKTIINNPQAHSKWYESLTRLQAVYMILDKKTGNQYIGTTYGQNGLWQRWESYAKGDFTGGNKELIELKRKNRNFHENFQYSILEVLSKNASQKECVDAESLWKEKLGTRTFGLNKN